MAEKSKLRLRLWLQLLRVTRSAENHLREHFRIHHQTTLPRFDVMAALYRRPEGMKMTELSRMLLVSNGNSTAVVDRLIKDGLVTRTVPERDRRSVQVAMTPKGIATFGIWAAEHEQEIATQFSNISDADAETMIDIFKRMGRKEHP